MKRSNNQFDFNTEELSNYEVKQIKKLTHKEYFIYMAGKTSSTISFIWLILFFILGIIMGVLI